MAQDFMTGKLIVIQGPTAVGKTGVAIEVAQALRAEVGGTEVGGSEIVSADSRQIYRTMDIGTAKPTPEQRQHAPHHLLDVVNPDENLGLAHYLRLAYETIDDIHRRGQLPMLVGGTGQYITALLEGWTVPEVAPNLSLRAELEQMAAEQGAESLLPRLRQLDPISADQIDYRNVRRVIRAIEVSQETGKPFSELKRKTPPPYTVFQIGLTMARDRLHQRADRRVDQMIADGFVEEVRHLLDMGYKRDLPSMSGLGYSQLAAHLQDGLPLAQAIALTKIATHQFIRKQYIWFRGHEQADCPIVWHNVEELDVVGLTHSISRWMQERT